MSYAVANNIDNTDTRFTRNPEDSPGIIFAAKKHLVRKCCTVISAVIVMPFKRSR